ncbi:MAG: response regulator [Oligoflexia bacterium]|nr:response regulator [Oligoflexia bacterium]
MNNKCKLLVVEDEIDLREAIVYDLKKRGFDVSEAGSGVEALRLVKENQYAVVVSDFRLPEGDGFWLLKNIKEANQYLPAVIFMTGYSEISLSDAFITGAEAVFTKPFNRNRFYALINELAENMTQEWRRDGYRTRVDLPVEVEYSSKTEKKKISTKIKDLGKGGFSVEIDDRPNEDGSCLFSIETGKDEIHSIQGSGIVQWCKVKEGDEEKYECGINFRSMPLQQKKELFHLLNLIRIQER